MAQDDMNNLLILCWFPAEYFFALFADQQMYCCSLCFAESEDYGNTNETVSAVQWLGFPEFLYWQVLVDWPEQVRGAFGCSWSNN